MFLDRDGVIIQNRSDYVRNWAQVEVFPWALEALATLKTSAYRIVIVSNQSAIGRGMITAGEVDDINLRLVECITAAGGRIDGIYICPHTPHDHCSCRKPKPGLILRAAAELDLNLEISIMIGDALEDIEAGRRAGVAVAAMVKTGRGVDQMKRPEVDRLLPFPTYERFDRKLVSRLIQGESAPPGIYGQTL